MESFQKKLGRVFTENFPGSTVELEPFEPRPKVGGFLTWSGFADMELNERVRRVWQVMKDELDEQELSRVGLIFPLTAVERARRREELASVEAHSRKSLAGS